jgi:elongation factor 1-beta
MESANLAQFEKTLNDQQFLGGQQPTSADREAFEALKNTVPSVATYPNTFAWWVLISRFNDVVRNTWAGPAPAKGAEKKAAPAKKEDAPAKKEEAATKKKDDDDDMDLFGDDDEDEAEAKKKLEEAKKANVKKVKEKPVAKSLIIFEVKPYEAETDLDELAKKIIAIEMEGLFWKTEYKKAPIAYGVEKIIIGCVVEDEKVSTDDLQEKIEAMDDLVQSVDIAAFNKI